MTDNTKPHRLNPFTNGSDFEPDPLDDPVWDQMMYDRLRAEQSGKPHVRRVRATIPDDEQSERPTRAGDQQGR